VKCKKIKNCENLTYSTHQLTCNFQQTRTLKCTDVEFAVKLNTKKVVLLHEHTLRRLHHSSVALSMMRCLKPCQPYHNVSNSSYEFFWERPAAEFLCKPCSSLGSDLSVGAIDLMK